MPEAIITRFTGPKGRLPVPYGDNHPVTQHCIAIAGLLRQLPLARLQAQQQALKASAIKEVHPSSAAPDATAKGDQSPGLPDTHAALVATLDSIP